MPFAWVGAGTAIVGAGSELGLWGDNGGGGGGGGGGASYGPGISYGYDIPHVDADWNALNDIGYLQSKQNSNIGNALNISGLTQQQAINYQPYQSAAYAAGQQTGQLANTYAGYGNTMANQAQNAIGQQNALQQAGRDVYNTALDPQSALYNRTRQQLTDQTAATNSMYGLGSSGAGAGIQNQALSNFNIDWQNNQLQRQLQGLQGMSGANQTALGYGSQAGADLTAAGTFQGQVPGLTQAAAQIPLNAQQYIAGQPQQQANQYLQTANAAASPLNAQMAQELAYMTGGSASQAGVAQLNQQQQQFNAQQQAGAVSGLTQGLGQLADLWKGSSWGGGGGTGSTGGYSSGYQPFQNTSNNNYGWSYQDF